MSLFRLRIAVCFFVLGLQLISYGSASALTLSGIVRDSKDNQPVPGALISVVGNRAISDVISDSGGHFSIELVSNVRAGDRIRIRSTKEGFRIYDKQISIGSDPVILIDLIGFKSAASGVRIDKVISLINEDQNIRSFEFLLSNVSDNPAWIDEFFVDISVERIARGFTGFVHQVDYSVQLDLDVKGNLIGEARPAISDLAYPVIGTFSAGMDTLHRGAQFWDLAFASPLRMKVDPNDRLLVVVNFQNPNGKVINEVEEGQYVAVSLMDFRSKFVMGFVGSDGTRIEQEVENLEFLEWFTGRL